MNNRILFYTIVKLWSDERTKASMYQGGANFDSLEKEENQGKKTKKIEADFIFMADSKQYDLILL